jgi:uncharacterized membrane protein YhdT
MNERRAWSLLLCVIGMVTLFSFFSDTEVGLVMVTDFGPVFGGAMIALSAVLARSRFRRLAYWAFGLQLVGVGPVLLISAFGGVGGNTGRSIWWSLTCLPQPLGWILCFVAGVCILAERNPPGGGIRLTHRPKSLTLSASSTENDAGGPVSDRSNAAVQMRQCGAYLSRFCHPVLLQQPKAFSDSQTGSGRL